MSPSELNAGDEIHLGLSADLTEGDLVGDLVGVSASTFGLFGFRATRFIIHAAGRCVFRMQNVEASSLASSVQMHARMC